MTTPRHGDRLRVVVVSDQSLVTESVRAALRERGLETSTLTWPSETTLTLPTAGPGQGLDAGLMISDLDRTPRLRVATQLLGGIRIPWLVLTGAPRGPMWGAALQAGARAVIANSTSLDSLLTMFDLVARGDDLMQTDEHDELVETWEAVRREHFRLQAQVDSLTPRERQVLLLLYDGESVHRIAALLEITPATVRSQVKAVLRKLEVNSQLAAVAAVGHLMEFQDPGDPVRS
jgi:RNA polymerase sigma factor (sigma-70 family)